VLWGGPDGVCRLRLSATVLAGGRAVVSRTGERVMKKSKSQPSTNEPMGIVITTGLQAPIEPLVRAYVWGPAPEEPASTDGSRAA